VTVASRDEAEDLLSEAFTRAWTNWKTVSTHDAPSAWVVRTALNLHRDRWRKKTNMRRHLAFVPLAHHDRFEIVDRALINVIRALPEQQRLVIAYRVLLDLSTEQTARELQIAEGTVSTHLKRGLATLRTHLQANDQLLKGKVK
jgi:RNA polymerase sigma-70 factor (ECF subfamily)